MLAYTPIGFLANYSYASTVTFAPERQSARLAKSKVSKRLKVDLTFGKSCRREDVRISFEKFQSLQYDLPPTIDRHQVSRMLVHAQKKKMTKNF